MPYTVVWTRKALTEIEGTRDSATAAELRLLIDALREIDDVLARTAPTAGESRTEGQRILIARPLAVVFEVVGDEAVISEAWWCVP